MRIGRQTTPIDCGVYVIQALVFYLHRKWISIALIKRFAIYGQRGLNLAELLKLGHKFGVQLEAFESSLPELQKKLSQTLIVVLINQGQGNHYVLAKIGARKVKIYDPARPSYYASSEEFTKIFTGVFLTINASTLALTMVDFKNPFRSLSTRPALSLAIIANVVIAVILAFFSTMFMREIVDKVISAHLSNTLVLLCLGFGYVALIRAILTFGKSALIKRLSLVFEWELLQTYSAKLATVDLKTELGIMRNDHLRRVTAITQVSTFRASFAFLMVNECLVFLIALFIMIWVSWIMLAVTLVFGLISMGVSIVFALTGRTHHGKSLHAGLASLTAWVSLIQNPEDVRRPSTCKLLINDLENKLLFAKQTEVKLWKISLWQRLLFETINLLLPVILVYVGVTLIFTTKLTVGETFMFLSISQFFISPLVTLGEMIVGLPRFNEESNLIVEILARPDEVINEQGLSAKNINSIKINNFAFGFDRPLFKIESLNMNASMHVVGPNGVGKSTFLKVLATLYVGDGELLYGGIERELYNLYSLRSRIIYLGRDAFFPDLTIGEYATDGDEKKMAYLCNNLLRFNLWPILENVGIKLNDRMNDNGEGLSSGQRQLVRLLKLFSNDFDIVLLDECFESIDTQNFAYVSAALVKHLPLALMVEVSHSGRFVNKDSEEVDFGKFSLI